MRCLLFFNIVFVNGMVSPVVSFDDFMKILKADLNQDIAKANEQVEEQLPNILDLKPKNRQRSMLLNPESAQKHMRGLIEQQDNADRFLDVVSAVRGESVEITEIKPGHRKDERDFIVRGRNPKTGAFADDFRVLIGERDNIRNEVSQAAFMKLLNLRVYREKPSLQ